MADERWDALAKGILADVEKQLGDVWEQVTPEQRAEIGQLAALYARVGIAGVLGEDVAEAKALLTAALESWKWIAADKVKKALAKAAGNAVLSIFKTALKLG